MPLWGPIRDGVIRWIVGQIDLVGTVRIHRVNLVIPISVRVKSDSGAITRLEPGEQAFAEALPLMTEATGLTLIAATQIQRVNAQ